MRPEDVKNWSKFFGQPMRKKTKKRKKKIQIIFTEEEKKKILWNWLYAKNNNHYWLVLDRLAQLGDLDKTVAQIQDLIYFFSGGQNIKVNKQQILKIYKNYRDKK